MNTRYPLVMLATALLISAGLNLGAQVPPMMSYQGRVQVSGTNFTGTGQFKFALVDPGTNAARLRQGVSSHAAAALGERPRDSRTLNQMHTASASATPPSACPRWLSIGFASAVAALLLGSAGRTVGAAAEAAAAPAKALGEEVRQGGFAVRFDRGAVTSLKRIADVHDTDYLQEGARFGDLQVRWRTSPITEAPGISAARLTSASVARSEPLRLSSPTIPYSAPSLTAAPASGTAKAGRSGAATASGGDST